MIETLRFELDLAGTAPDVVAAAAKELAVDIDGLGLKAAVSAWPRCDLSECGAHSAFAIDTRLRVCLTRPLLLLLLLLGWPCSPYT